MSDYSDFERDLEGQLDEAMAILKEMVAINSFTGNREGVNLLGRRTAELFSPLGFTAEFVPAADERLGDHPWAASLTWIRCLPRRKKPPTAFTGARNVTGI